MFFPFVGFCPRHPRHTPQPLDITIVRLQQMQPLKVQHSEDAAVVAGGGAASPKQAQAPARIVVILAISCPMIYVIFYSRLVS